ncbi:MAG: NAD(P)/FAD-dependent oxidoreductase [Bacteroidota bacterium]
MKVAIIGGGAAGFFAAIAAKKNHPQAQVVILEKSKKLLSKVKISGGGRCNVTNGCTNIKDLANAYPRGGKKLKQAFRLFNTQHTVEWFESRGVPLFVEADGRVFPISQSSQTVIDCLLKETTQRGITIEIQKGVKAIFPQEGKLELQFSKPIFPNAIFDKVIIATGGSPRRKGLEWLENLGHQIEEPVPSLFTFNMPQEKITELMGIVVEQTLVSIQGTKLKSNGPLLITHWGMSGPAILKLSAFGARILNEMNYEFKVQVNWVNELNHEVVLRKIKNIITIHARKYLANVRPYALKERLWSYLLEKCKLSPQKRWEELGKKGVNKLVNILTNDVYEVNGKTTFKEEFVTCGGVSLESIDFKTMQSKAVPNLYFTGEVMDIDGITGGYNFQAAWTTAVIAGALK